MAVDKLGPWDINGPDKLLTLAILGSAEALGTALLVFLGCSSALSFHGIEPSILSVALGFGFAVTIAVMVVGHISGAHINPVVSLAALILGQISPLTFLVYFVSQCIGSIFGMQSVLMVASGNFTADFCVTQINHNITPYGGLIAECIFTAILVLLVCSVWDERNSNNHDSVPLRFGVGIIVLIIAGGKYTGCSMNPARSFGPSFLSGNWKNHWVYWIGPFCGGALSVLFYKFLFLRQNVKNNPEYVDQAENEPLKTKLAEIPLEVIETK